MSLKAVGPGALAVAVLVGLGESAQAQAAYTAYTVTSVFYREFKKDGRFFVFNNPAAAAAFEQSRETGVGITRIGIGPNGESVFADNETALELFLFKHGLTAEVKRPSAPPLNIVWRDGKTRMTIGSNFYLELSNRVQIRYTHILPDDAVRLPGAPAAGDSQGSFRIRRMKLKFEGWFYKPWLQYEVQTNWPGISSANLGNFLEDANINWDVTKGKKQFMVKFGQFKVPKLADPSQSLAPVMSDTHEWLFWALIALVAVHAGAAFYHHLFQHDATLTRMLPRRRATASPASEIR